ncbi:MULTISPECIES: SapC family protein [Shewanella]|uniref:SapC family protein n=1 Tax=Shewanella TaxID=22 RepID=UPI0007EEB286|nr:MULTISPECIES: SapC family protein [Shewanella]OBT11513.1 multidrug transporter [Shewanella sp. UCD-FRSSP16_17]
MNHVLLNNVEHKELRINTQRSAELGDDLWFAATFLAEIKTAQAHYPILFQKHSDTGEFSPVTLFGFKNQENLFLTENGWDASYIPLSVQRMPFYIGYQKTAQDGVTDMQRVITLDTDSPRVSSNQGTALFLPLGGNSDYLEHIGSVLETLHLGLQENQQFIAALIHCDLLESVSMDIKLNDSSHHQLIGFYIINEERLAKLEDAELLGLHHAGYLEVIYMIIASQAHINKLIERKNKQLNN